MSNSVIPDALVVNEARGEAAILIYTPHNSTNINRPIRVTDKASLDSALQALSRIPHKVCGLRPSVMLLWTDINIYITLARRLVLFYIGKHLLEKEYLCLKFIITNWLGILVDILQTFLRSYWFPSILSSKQLSVNYLDSSLMYRQLQHKWSLRASSWNCNGVPVTVPSAKRKEFQRRLVVGTNTDA